MKQGDVIEIGMGKYSFEAEEVLREKYLSRDLNDQKEPAVPNLGKAFQQGGEPVQIIWLSMAGGEERTGRGRGKGGRRQRKVLKLEIM